MAALMGWICAAPGDPADLALSFSVLKQTRNRDAC